MKSLVILPGDAPRWVCDHARHLAQRLTEIGRVTVVSSAREPSRSLLPGQPSNGSVLGHSVAGYPIWTGRMTAALGLRWSSKFTVIVMWPGANGLLACCAAAVARMRRERLILDIPEIETSVPTIRARVASRVLGWLAHDVVCGSPPSSDASSRVVLMLCGEYDQMARLAVRAVEGMADSAASSWTWRLQIDPAVADPIGVDERRERRVITEVGEPTPDLLQVADVVVADYDAPFADLVRQSVLSGGAGVLVGHPVAGRVARCHDGVWLAQRDSAAILVALEASTGDAYDRPVPVAKMREQTERVVDVISDMESVQ